MGPLFMDSPTTACPHFDITDEGICIECSIDISSDEFLDSLPEAPATETLGDLMGILRLARATAELFIEQREGNRDPTNPALFKLRTVGVHIMRLPDSVFWTGILQPSYVTAKALGYRSSFDCWSTICKDYLDELNKD
jgi:hypothetical protein